MSAQHRVVIVDSLHGGYLEQPDMEREVLGSVAEVELLRVQSGEELYGRIEDADAIICWHHIAIDKPLIERLRHCCGIIRAAVGYDNMDLAAAGRCGIPICNIPDYGTEEVADHAWALILALVRRLPVLDRHCRDGGWDWRAIGSVRRLRGEKLGIVGFGRIGSAVARRAHAFGIEVGFYDPYLPSGADKAHGVKRYEDLHELLRNSGIVTVHVNLTEETCGLIGAAEFACMGSNTILVNTARGDVIDLAAMLDALAKNGVAALGLDVVADEPNIPLVLRNDERCLLTAHSAFYADSGLRELRIKAAQSALNMLSVGHDRNIVNGFALKEHPARRNPHRR